MLYPITLWRAINWCSSAATAFALQIVEDVQIAARRRQLPYCMDNMSTIYEPLFSEDSESFLSPVCADHDYFCILRCSILVATNRILLQASVLVVSQYVSAILLL